MFVGVRLRLRLRSFFINFIVITVFLVLVGLLIYSFLCSLISSLSNVNCFFVSKFRKFNFCLLERKEENCVKFIISDCRILLIFFFDFWGDESLYFLGYRLFGDGILYDLVFFLLL